MLVLPKLLDFVKFKNRKNTGLNILSHHLSLRWNVCPGAHHYITALIPTVWPRPVPWSDVTNGIIPCRQYSDPGPAKLPAPALF